MVPKWVRGRESLELVEPVRQPLPMLGLGNSVGTPAAGLEARRRRRQGLRRARRRAPPTSRAASSCSTWRSRPTARRCVVPARRTVARGGARRRRRCCVRSVGPTGLRTPHTGATVYDDGAPQIPAAAISAEDADRFQRLQDRGVPHPRASSSMEAHFEPDAQSYNVVGELRGRELPDEIVRRRRPLRFVGRRHRRERRRRRVHRDVGGAAADEDSSACGRGARCASCCSRTKRTACAAATATATRTRPSSRTTCCCWNPTAASSIPTGFGFTGPDDARADGHGDREPAERRSAPSRSLRVRRRRRHRPGRPRPARSR